MLWSAIIADILAFIVAIILLSGELKKLNNLNENNLIEDEKVILNPNILKNKVIITIAREYGSGGHFVGKLLAEKLGIPFYDKEIINISARDYGYSSKYVELNEEQPIKSTSYYGNNDKLFETESKIIADLANKESCVIVGRCADYVLRNQKDLVRVFLYSDMNSKIKRVVKYYGLPEEIAEKEIKKINKQRAKYYEHFTNKEWMSFENYDLAINVDKLGVEQTAEMIKNIILKEDENK